jgi:hypothetical protein
MAGTVACAGCGKEYRWKPELAGKRAKCKCGGVVSFPKEDPVAPPPPPLPDVPEGFEDYAMAADAPPPPPPPPPIPGRRPAAAAAPATGGIKDSTAKSSGGGVSFHWNWKAALNVLIGLGLIVIGFVEFIDIAHREAAGETIVFRGRRSGYLTIMYAIGGRFGVLGLFALAGLLFIGGAVLTFMGKIGHSSSEH